MHEKPIPAEASPELCRSLLQDGYSIRLPAKGNSMRPWIRPGDHLTVQPILPAKLHIGMVILYEFPETVLTAHRVIRINPVDSTVDTRGDATLGAVETIPFSSILGQCSRIEPHHIRFMINPCSIIFGKAWLTFQNFRRKIRGITENSSFTT